VLLLQGVETAKLIQTRGVIGVRMGIEDGIDVSQIGLQGLFAKIG
jgi:hypothetical protein